MTPESGQRRVGRADNTLGYTPRTTLGTGLSTTPGSLRTTTDENVPGSASSLAVPFVWFVE